MKILEEWAKLTDKEKCRYNGFIDFEKTAPRRKDERE